MSLIIVLIIINLYKIGCYSVTIIAANVPVLYFGPLKASNDYRGKVKANRQRNGNGFR